MRSSFSHSPEETREFGASFARSLTDGAVVGLIGDLGSGKTTFVQGMAVGLGIDPSVPVCSPTFTLIHEYAGRLIHIDLYRIEGSRELQNLPLEESIGSGAIVVIEWAERLGAWKKVLDFEVRFEIDSQCRRITMHKRIL